MLDLVVMRVSLVAMIHLPSVFFDMLYLALMSPSLYVAAKVVRPVVLSTSVLSVNYFIGMCSSISDVCGFRFVGLYY